MMRYRIDVDASLPVTELSLMFANIPTDATVLDLSENNIGNITQTWQLGLAIAKIPRHITGLYLGGNGLYTLGDGRIAHLFLKIPQTIIELNLADNRLGASEQLKLEMIFGTLPNLRILDLWGNCLSDRDEEGFLSVFTSLPKHLTHLDLGDNNLYHHSSILPQAFALLPSTLTHLCLANNDLGTMSQVELAQVLIHIPPNVTSLDLSNNSLESMEFTELKDAFAALPKQVNTLTLCINDLEKRTKKELIELGKMLPYVVKLDILDNEGQPSLHVAVDLLKNHIGYGFIKPYQTLHEECNYPKVVVNLIMEYNDPFISNDITSFVTQQNILRQASFSQLPSEITALNLRGRCLEGMSFEELRDFFATIPKHVKTLTLDFDGIGKRSKDELIALGKALPHVITLNILNAEGQLIPHAAVNILKNHIGHHVMEIYKTIHEEHHIPQRLVGLIMEYDAPFEEDELTSFISQRSALIQSYSFHLHCVYSLAALSITSLAIGIIALCLMTPLGLGITCTTLGTVSGLLASYGLFKASKLVEQEWQMAPNETGLAADL